MGFLVTSGEGVISPVIDGSGITILGLTGSSGRVSMRLATRRLGSFLSGKPVTIILSPIFNLEKPNFDIPTP